jgi:type I restriction enzyme S subunit
MSEWRQVTLGEVCELKRGYDLPAHKREPGNVPIVSSSGITGYHSEAKVAGPGVVTGRYGTLGEVFFIMDDFWPLNTALYVRDFKKNDPRFVAALLETLELGRNDGAAAVPGVNRNQLHTLRVSCPGVSTQRRISAVLGAIDDLVENNRRRTDLLDELAQAIYREWFVRFRFPGYGDSGLVDSALGLIPKGWKITTIGDVCDSLTRGIAPQYAEDGHWTVLNQRCIRDRQVTLDLARRQNRRVPAVKQVQFGDVLVNSTGVGTLGRVGIVLESHDALTVDSHVTIVRPSDGAMEPWFGLHMLQRQAELEGLGAGSTGQTELGRRVIAGLPLVLPPTTILAHFADVGWPLVRPIPRLLEQNRRLVAMRNLLLPRLMTGQIDLSEIDFAAVADSVA